MQGSLRTAQAAIALAAVLPMLGGAGTATARPPAAGLSRAASHGLDVLPVPGTPDAPPGTPIDFPALAPRQIARVRVTGSRTGWHRGRLRPQPRHAGAQFLPDRAFAPGERITVLAQLRSRQAGAASGAPHSARLRFSFSIGRAASANAASTGAAAPNYSGMVPAHVSAAAGSGEAKTHSFLSEPGLHPPTVRMIGRDTDRTGGDIFLDAENSGQNAPYILNPDGDLLWDHPTASHGAGPDAFNLRVQTYRGRPVLTYFLGHLISPANTGNGVGVMLNEHYTRIHTITAGAGYERDGTDEHELSVTPQGTALVSVYAPVRANLTSVGGPAKGTVLDSIVQEIDIATNRVVWEWDALAHVPVGDSHLPYRSGVPYDYFHINSIQQLPNGQIVISARHTWAVYLVAKKTGRIQWEAGGKRSSFRFGSGASFEWQHDATLGRNDLMTVFDDGSAGAPRTQKERQSRGLLIRLSSGRATLVRAYLHTPPVLAASQGSVQTLFNHNVFIGWGSAPSFSEYTASGTQIFNAWFRYPVASYRAYRFNNWAGAPLGAPSITVRASRTKGQDSVYVSWNGATRVASWRLYAGASRSALAPVQTVPWASFETRIQARARRYFSVRALGANGRRLPHGSSPVVRGP